MTNLPEEVDEQNVINMVSEAVRSRVLQVYEKTPDYQLLGEIQLRDLIHPSQTANRLRMAFWDEYMRAKDTGKKMVMKNIYAKVMTFQSFYNDFMKKDINVAWMLCPPGEYFLAMKADLYKGKDELGKILHMPLFDESGNVKIKEAYLFLKVFELYDNRVHGSVVQRIEQKTATVHMHSPTDIDGDPDKLREELERHKKMKDVVVEKERKPITIYGSNWVGPKPGEEG